MASTNIQKAGSHMKSAYHIRIAESMGTCSKQHWKMTIISREAFQNY